MIILDTCILIELQKGNQDIKQQIYEYNQQDLYITPVVVAEFYRGAKDKSDLIKCKKLKAFFSVLSLDERVIHVFDYLSESYALSHRPSVPDMLIAATAVR
ncbi:PIN domain-containing protein [Mucilaginibacter terrae]|uniref:PIN domain-containing protein n=1 Tax=Mucilaginibacter terrae TaxID=1955052 RepID=UPI00362DE0EB